MSKKKVLIVDDEPDVVKWLTVLLNEHGYETVDAKDGKEGFEKAKSEKPDLITLDISMPGESGVKMYRNLFNDDATSGIPVIMVTAATPKLKEFLDRVKPSRPPAGFFEKPIDKDELITKIAELVN